jgi:hypothetical protein
MTVMPFGKLDDVKGMLTSPPPLSALAYEEEKSTAAAAQKVHLFIRAG